MRRPTTSPITLFLTCAVNLGLSTSALAEEPDPEPYPPCENETADTTAAKGAFQAGTAAFNEADYERAIIYWEDAYRRDCSAHALLKNLARAYELNGMFKHAIHALRTYMERNPNPAEQDSLERRIANLEARLAEANPPTPEPEPDSQPVAPEPEPSPEMDQDTSQGERAAWPLYVAGGGAAVGLVGLVFFLDAKSDENAIAESCETQQLELGVVQAGERNCPPELARRGNEAIDRVNFWGGFTLVGAGIGVAGVIYYFAQPTEPTQSAWTPVLAPGYAGLNYGSRF